jgi:hypothetical protein
MNNIYLIMEISIECEVCHKQFDKIKNLKRHEKTHNMEV